MKTKITLALTFALLLATGAAAQGNQHPLPATPPQLQSEPQQAGSQHEHHEMEIDHMQHMQMQSVEQTAAHVSDLQEPENPERKTGGNLPLPDLLENARKNPPKGIAEFEQLALTKNPTLRQAQAISAQSSAEARQAGLWPNPSIGYEGAEIRGGSFHGGEQGGFVQQTIVLGGKLRLRREALEQQHKADEIGIEEQKLEVIGAVRVHFYQALAAQKSCEIRAQLLQLAMDAAATVHQLANVGQADAPDVLQTEVEAEQAKLDFARSQRNYIQAFNTLAAIAGEPGLPLTLLAGDLEHPPEIDLERWTQDAIQNSPTVKRAQQETKRAEAELARERREPLPDLTLRAGEEQNREVDPTSMRAVGAQSFASASIQLPIFNRNQGNIQAAKAELERSQEEVERLKLSMAQTAQPLLQQYATDQLQAERYRTQMIPRAQRAYELYLQKYQDMAAAYPEVIISQRTFFQLQENYVQTLGELWTTAVRLQNYLHAEGLSAPGMSGRAISSGFVTGASGTTE
jgi:outer membrane protein, heavy metal efflux system